MTRKQIEKFIELRNKNPFGNNFAFQGDLELAGLSPDDLGNVNHLKENGIEVWLWNTPFGKLVERGGILTFENNK